MGTNAQVETCFKQMLKTDWSLSRRQRRADQMVPAFHSDVDSETLVQLTCFMTWSQYKCIVIRNPGRILREIMKKIKINKGVPAAQLLLCKSGFTEYFYFRI